MRSPGLKLLRSADGPVDPNKYWGRKPRPKCRECGKKIRGKGHSAARHPGVVT